jgi:hypothetical protein
MQPEDPDTQSPNQSRKKNSRKIKNATQVLYPHRQARKGSLVMNSLTTAQVLNERGTDTPGCVSSMRSHLPFVFLLLECVIISHHSLGTLCHYVGVRASGTVRSRSLAHVLYLPSYQVC